MATASRKIVFWEVDAQQDFMLPGGKLYVPGAERIIPNIKRLVDAAQKARMFLVSSACAHAANDPEFATFPPHCIRGTEGARIVPEGLTKDYLIIPNRPSFPSATSLFDHAQIVIEKQALDVFSNPHTNEIIERLGPEVTYVVFGVVTEYCVHFAAKGLLDCGRKVFVVEDAIETLKAEESARALGELKAMGAQLITTDEAIQTTESGSVASARPYTKQRNQL
jgi:nicotinamidase/pyrazinamidase